MKTISAKGGWGNEALEIGFMNAANEMEEGGLSQIIVIGDMPPNTRSEVQRKRSSLTSQVFGSSVPETYWEDELQKLQGVKVHTFYITEAAREVFERIASLQGGSSCHLDINSPSGADMLTKLVTRELLRAADGVRGEDLVRAYDRKFGRL